jgi:hypothetical protein
MACQSIQVDRVGCHGGVSSAEHTSKSVWNVRLQMGGYGAEVVELGAGGIL